MSLFNAVLQGLQKKLNTQTAYKGFVIESFRSCIGVTVAPDDIVSLRDGVLTIRTNPTVKSAILLKQPAIILKMKELGLSVVIIR